MSSVHIKEVAVSVTASKVQDVPPSVHSPVNPSESKTSIQTEDKNGGKVKEVAVFVPKPLGTRRRVADTPSHGVDLSHFQIGKLVGYGRYASVFKGIRHTNRKAYAVNISPYHIQCYIFHTFCLSYIQTFLPTHLIRCLLVFTQFFSSVSKGLLMKVFICESMYVFALFR